jgi:hypothetical protein
LAEIIELIGMDRNGKIKKASPAIPIVFFTLTKKRFMGVKILFCFFFPSSKALFLFLMALSMKKAEVLKKKVTPINPPIILIREAVIKL